MEAILDIISALGKVMLTAVNESPSLDSEDRKIIRKCNAIVNAITGSNFKIADE